MISYTRLFLLPLLNILGINVKGLNIYIPFYGHLDQVDSIKMKQQEEEEVVGEVNSYDKKEKLFSTKISNISCSIRFKSNSKWSNVSLDIDICKEKEGKIRMYTNNSDKIILLAANLCASNLKFEFIWPKKGDILLIKTIKPHAINLQIGKFNLDLNLSRDALPFWKSLLIQEEIKINRRISEVNLPEEVSFYYKDCLFLLFFLSKTIFFLFFY